jgi:hypothetical protein
MEAIILSETIVNVLKNRQQDDPERPQIDRRSVERVRMAQGWAHRLVIANTIMNFVVA